MQDTFNIPPITVLLMQGDNEKQNAQTETPPNNYQTSMHFSQLSPSQENRFQVDSSIPTISSTRVFVGLEVDNEAARGTARPASRPDSTNTAAPSFTLLASTRSSSRRVSLDSSESTAAVGMTEDELITYLNVDSLGLTTQSPVQFQQHHSPNLAFPVPQSEILNANSPAQQQFLIFPDHTVFSNLMDYSNVPHPSPVTTTVQSRPYYHNYYHHPLIRPPTPTNLHLPSHHQHHQEQQYQEPIQQHFQSHILHQQFQNPHLLQILPYPFQNNNTPISFFSSSPPHTTTPVPSTSSFLAAPRNSAISTNATQVTISSPLATVSSSTLNAPPSSPSQSSSPPFSPSSSSKIYSMRRLRRHSRRHITTTKTQIHSISSLQTSDSSSKGTTTHGDTRTRQYECATCHNRFLRRQDLFRHESTHSNARNFLCGFGCGAAFGRSDGATRHMRKRSCRFATTARGPAIVVASNMLAAAVEEVDKKVGLRDEDCEDGEDEEC
ncbi:hypothetical protein HK100_007471, partial [Physocladia obscura]